MVKKIFITIVTILMLLCLWQIIENQINANRVSHNETSLEAFIPTPLTILKTYRQDGVRLMTEAGYTLQRALLGLLIGLLLALCVSATFLFLPFLRNIFFPISFAINSFPVIGLAPVIILTFGQGSWLSIVFVATLICYFPILISLDTAYRNIDKEIIEIMQVFNASRRQIFFKAQLPLSLPYLFMSLKLSIPASIIGATMGEWLGSRTGIGQLITLALYQLKPGLLYAGLILIVAISVLSIIIINIIEHYFFHWHYRKNHP